MSEPSTQHSAVSSQPDETPPLETRIEQMVNALVVDYRSRRVSIEGAISQACVQMKFHYESERAALMGALEAALEQGCGCPQITANHNHHTATCFVPKAQAALRAAKESAQ